MESELIKKFIKINASRKRVWEVLLDDKYTRQWYEEFSEGAHAITDWQLGSKAVFKDSSGTGLVGKVVVNRPYEVISLEFEGIIEGNREDLKSSEAQRIKGSRETYRLLEHNDKTQLIVEADMLPEMFDSMSIAWKKALEKLKKLAESK